MNYHWNVIYDRLAKFLLSPTRFKHICHRNKPHLSSPEKFMPFSARTKPEVTQKSHFQQTRVKLSHLPVSIFKSCEDNRKRVTNLRYFT